MIKKDSAIARGSSYLFFKIIAYAIALVSIPLLTNTLSMGDYGKISVLEANLAFIIPFFTLGLDQAYIRYYSVAEKNNYLRRFDYNVSFLSLITAVLCAVFTIVFFWFTEGTGGISLPIILGIYAGFSILLQEGAAFLRARGQTYLHSSLIGAQSILNHLLPLMAVLLFGAVIRNYLIARTLAVVSVCVIILLLVRKYIHKDRLDKNIQKELLKYGLPLLFASLGSIIFSNGDRLIISALMGEEAVAVYTVPAQASYALEQIIIYPLSMMLTPTFINKWEKDSRASAEAFANKGLKMYLFICVVLSFFMISMSGEVMEVLAPESYAYGAAILPVLSTGLLVYGIYFFVSLGFFVEKKTVTLGLLTLGCAGLNIALNFVFGQLWGLMGICIATVTAYFAYLVVAYRFSKKTFSLKIPWLDIGRFILSAFVGFVIVWLLDLDHLHLVLRVVIKIAVILLPYIVLNYKYFKELLSSVFGRKA